ncbi:MAG: Na+/H+ antiporter subunit E [Candidatus Omnitrophota bacterium]
MMKIKVIIFILAFLVWLILNWSLDLEHVVTGVLLGIFISFMTSDIFTTAPHIFKNSRRYLWLIYYVFLFAWECIKANIDGAYRVIHPDLPINPGIVKVKTTLKSATALTFLSNTITLKPGTMTVDIDRENKFLYIHWADVKSQDVQQASAIIIRKFEDILKKIFE